MAHRRPLDVDASTIPPTSVFFPPPSLSVEAHMLGSQRFGETHFMLIVYLIRNSNCLEGLINSWKSNGAGCVPPCHAVCVRQ